MFSTLLNCISSYKSKSLLVTGCHLIIRGWWFNIILNVYVPTNQHLEMGVYITIVMIMVLE